MRTGYLCAIFFALGPLGEPLGPLMGDPPPKKNDGVGPIQLSH